MFGRGIALVLGVLETLKSQGEANKGSMKRGSGSSGSGSMDRGSNTAGSEDMDTGSTGTDSTGTGPTGTGSTGMGPTGTGSVGKGGVRVSAMANLAKGPSGWQVLDTARFVNPVTQSLGMPGKFSASPTRELLAYGNEAINGFTSLTVRRDAAIGPLLKLRQRNHNFPWRLIRRLYLHSHRLPLRPFKQEIDACFA